MTSVEDTTNATIVMATKVVTTTIAKAVDQAALAFGLKVRLDEPEPLESPGSFNTRHSPNLRTNQVFTTWVSNA